MPTMQQSINKHYHVSNILSSIQDALTTMGKDMKRLIPSDLALVDEFQLCGRESTLELADRADIQPGLSGWTSGAAWVARCATWQPRGNATRPVSTSQMNTCKWRPLIVSRYFSW